MGDNMLQIVIEWPECMQCGQCDNHLPGILQSLKKGPIMVNLNNEGVNKDQINKAVDVCPTGCLYLQDLRGNPHREKL